MSPGLYWLLKAHFPRCAPRWVEVVQIIETACAQKEVLQAWEQRETLFGEEPIAKGTCATDNLLLLIAAEDTDFVKQGRGCG
jgi:hypothetical protein